MTEPLNPYSPPRSEVELPSASRAIVPASKGRRLGTLIIDYVLYLVFSMCIGIVIALFFGEEGVEVMQAIPDFLLGAPILVFYYVVFEGIWARTPGKLVFGTVVVSESGAKPSIGQIFGRTLCRLIPFEAFSFLGKTGWHDSIPKTRVVMARAS